MLKGHVKIDLHNHNSGFTERIEQDNLVTDAVGILASVHAGANKVNNFLPLAKKALGGLMLFDGELEENKSNIWFPCDVHITGFAGQWVNTSNPLCGSINFNETHETDTGYETVWDFSTSQANGEIASVALTYAPYSDSRGNIFTGYTDEALADFNQYCYPFEYTDDQMMYFVDVYSNRIVYTLSGGIYTAKINVGINRAYEPETKYRVNDGGMINKWGGKIKDIEIVVEGNKNNFLNENANMKYLMNGYDGYAYMIYSPGNTSGDGTFNYTRIKVSDGSFDTDEIKRVTLTGIKLKEGINSAAVCKGKCFIGGNDRRYIYIVDLSNTADIKMADLGEGNQYKETKFISDPGGTVRITIHNSKDNKGYIAIIYPDGTVVCNETYIDMYEKSNFTTRGLIISKDGNGYKYFESSRYAVANYLGTICNLSSKITKTAATSMKITYTLTDAAADTSGNT